jgi:hypothetical protein
LSILSPDVKKPCFEITQREIDSFKGNFPAHYNFLVECVKDGFFKIIPDAQVKE